MDRRGFLATLASAAAAVALSPIEATYAVVLKDEPPITFEELAAELRSVYPPGWADRLVNQEAPFRRALRSS